MRDAFRIASRRCGEDWLDALIDGFKIAVGYCAGRGVIEIVEPVPDFAASLNAYDGNVGIGGKDEEVEAAADNDTALGGARLDDSRIRAFKHFDVVNFICEIQNEIPI